MPINNVIEGDLIKLALEGRYDAIAQGCNIFCTMGSGIAPQIANAFPVARLVDNLTEYGDVSKLGTMSKGTHPLDGEKEVIIYNLYTQVEFGTPANGVHNVNYEAVAKCFTELNRVLRECDNFKVGIPAIGCGLAKGHWEAIKTIINLVTPDLDIELVILP